MMAESFEFRETTHFTVGTVGGPGERVFYLQVGDPFNTASVKLEKAQVQALSQFLKGLLNDLPAPTETITAALFKEPPGPDWTVGQIAVGVDDQGDASHLVLVIEEFTPDFDDEDDVPNLADPLGLDEPDVHNIRAHITVEQAAAFIDASKELMAKGRPPCRLCGQPLDTKHACPRLN